MRRSVLLPCFSTPSILLRAISCFISQLSIVTGNRQFSLSLNPTSLLSLFPFPPVKQSRMSASDKPQRPGKLGGVLNALKRVSFTRRASSESFKEKEQSSAAAAPPSTNRNTLSRTRSASSLAPSNAPSSSQEVGSIRPTLLRLNSASPASELPKTSVSLTLSHATHLTDTLHCTVRIAGLNGRKRIDR